MLLAPVVENQKGEFRDVLEKLAREGFVRARIDGELTELEANARVPLDGKETLHRGRGRVDRQRQGRGRLADSVETCLKGAREPSWHCTRLLI